jgi:hypothetical protein
VWATRAMVMSRSMWVISALSSRIWATDARTIEANTIGEIGSRWRVWRGDVGAVRQAKCRRFSGYGTSRQVSLALLGRPPCGVT